MSRVLAAPTLLLTALLATTSLGPVTGCAGWLPDSKLEAVESALDKSAMALRLVNAVASEYLDRLDPVTPENLESAAKVVRSLREARTELEMARRNVADEDVSGTRAHLQAALVHMTAAVDTLDHLGAPVAEVRTVLASVRFLLGPDSTCASGSCPIPTDAGARD